MVSGDPMRKVFLALVLLCFNPLAHAMLVHGGALYEDGSTFDFIWDDSREGLSGRPYSQITFTHDTFHFTKTCCYGLDLIESLTDEGDIFGDSLEDTWSFAGVDLTADDYFFTPNGLLHGGGNYDGWHEGTTAYRSNAVHSYMTVLIPEPGSMSLLVLGGAGLLVLRRRTGKPTALIVLK
jgi:hypothetical protein